MKPVEKNQTVCAGLICHVGHVAEKRTELDRHRNVNRDLDRPKDVNVSLLYFKARNVRVCRNEIDIALNGISPGLLDLLGMFSPTAKSRTIEARNDRNIDCFLSFGCGLDKLQGRCGIRWAGK